MEKRTQKKTFTPLSEKALKTATIRQLLDKGYDITSPEVIASNKRDIVKLEASIKAKEEKIKSRIPPKSSVGAPAPSDAREPVGITAADPIHNEEPVALETTTEAKEEDTTPEVIPEIASSPIKQVELLEKDKEPVAPLEQKDIPVIHLEQLESNFIAKREMYVKELNKYNTERKTWRQSAYRLGQWLGITSEEEHLAEKYPNLIALKNTYDAARMTYSETAIIEKTAAIKAENPNITKEALTQTLNEYREGVINKRIHHEEYPELTNAQAEKLPPNRKQIYDKLAGAYGWYAKGTGFGAKVKRAAISTAVFGTVGVSFGAAAAMGTGAYLGYRFAKGVISATTSGMVVKVIKNYQEKSMKKFTDMQASAKEKALSDFNTGIINLVQYENKLKEIEKSIEKKNRNQLLARAGAGLLVGFGTSYGIQAAGGQTLYEDAYRSIKGGAPEGGSTVHHPQIGGTPIEKKPGMISSQEKPTHISDYAKVRATEGITHALKAQLENNTELAQKLGYPLSGTTMEKAHFLMNMAKSHGYIDDTGEIRVGEVGAAYVLNADGSITEYAPDGTTSVETHVEGGSNNDLSGGNESYEYREPMTTQGDITGKGNLMNESQNNTTQQNFNSKEPLIDLSSRKISPIPSTLNNEPLKLHTIDSTTIPKANENGGGGYFDGYDFKTPEYTESQPDYSIGNNNDGLHFTKQDGGAFVLRNQQNPLNQKLFNVRQRMQGYNPRGKYYNPNAVKWSKTAPGSEPTTHATPTPTPKVIPSIENIEAHKHNVIDKIFGHKKLFGKHVHGEDSESWKKMKNMTLDKIMNGNKKDFPRFERDEVNDIKFLMRKIGMATTDPNGKPITVDTLTKILAKMEVEQKLNVATLLAKEH